MYVWTQRRTDKQLKLRSFGLRWKSDANFFSFNSDSFLNTFFENLFYVIGIDVNCSITAVWQKMQFAIFFFQNYFVLLNFICIPKMFILKIKSKFGINSMSTLWINSNSNIAIANESFYKCNMNGMRFIILVRDTNNWRCWIVLEKWETVLNFH